MVVSCVETITGYRHIIPNVKKEANYIKKTRYLLIIKTRRGKIYIFGKIIFFSIQDKLKLQKQIATWATLSD